MAEGPDVEIGSVDQEFKNIVKKNPFTQDDARNQVRHRRENPEAFQKADPLLPENLQAGTEKVIDYANENTSSGEDIREVQNSRQVRSYLSELHDLSAEERDGKRPDLHDLTTYFEKEREGTPKKQRGRISEMRGIVLKVENDLELDPAERDKVRLHLKDNLLFWEAQENELAGKEKMIARENRETFERLDNVFDRATTPEEERIEDIGRVNDSEAFMASLDDPEGVTQLEFQKEKSQAILQKIAEARKPTFEQLDQFGEALMADVAKQKEQNKLDYPQQDSETPTQLDLEGTYIEKFKMLLEKITNNEPLLKDEDPQNYIDEHWELVQVIERYAGKGTPASEKILGLVNKKEAKQHRKEAVRSFFKNGIRLKKRSNHKEE